MTKCYPQKADHWREITDSCLAQSVVFTAVLPACQELSAYRTCCLPAAQTKIVQEVKSSVREVNSLSVCNFSCLVLQLFSGESKLVSSLHMVADSGSVSWINLMHCFLTQGKVSIINMQEKNPTL